MKILLVKDTKRDISELTNRQAVSILGTWMSTLSLLEDEISRVCMNACTWRDKVQNLKDAVIERVEVDGNGINTMRFKRSLDTSDSIQDVVLSNEEIHFILYILRPK